MDQLIALIMSSRCSFQEYKFCSRNRAVIIASQYYGQWFGRKKPSDYQIINIVIEWPMRIVTIKLYQ